MVKWTYLLFIGMLLTPQAGALAGNATGAGRRPDLRDQPSGPSAPATPPYVTYLPFVNQGYVPGYVSPFGIDMYDGNTNPEGQAQMQAATTGWETVLFEWDKVEPIAPVAGVHVYHWSGFDAIATRAQAAGMRLFVLFTSNPSWAAPLGGGPVTSAHVADLNSMAAAAAERYDGDGVNDAPGSPVVRYWSFYAEPDNNSLSMAQATGKGYWGDNAYGYADMLAGVSAAMHAASSKVVVMIGGLAYDSFTPSGHYVKTFLGQVLYRLNAHDGGVMTTLDAVAFHYYPINSDWPTIKEKTSEIRSILSAHGAVNLPLIVPEMGYWSDPVPSNPDWNSSPAQQARRMVEMFVQGLSVGIKQLSWFAVFDTGPGTEAHGLFYGTDLTNPKPAYTAYATLTAELYGGTYASQLSGSGLEGYVFAMAGGTQKTVVWATAASANVTFHQSCLRRVDYLGTATKIGDGNPTWDKDATPGQITLQVLKDQPVYVGSC